MQTAGGHPLKHEENAGKQALNSGQGPLDGRAALVARPEALFNDARLEASNLPEAS